jgi:undecaprenyl-diphosphatase
MERTGLRWIFALILSALFILDLWLVVSGQIKPFDESLLGCFYIIRNEFLTNFFTSITFAGNPGTMVVLSILIICLPYRMKVGLPVALMTTIGWGVQTLLKNIIARPRPDPAYWLISMGDDVFFQSFPSGHSNAGMILWVALAILIGRLLILQNYRFAAILLRIVFVVFALLVGTSRLYLGVHYPSDVFGGWLLAGVILSVCFLFYDRYWPAKWRVSLCLDESERYNTDSH